MSDAATILAHAQSLLDHSHDETAGMWPRAAALLARQALESALEDFWSWKEPRVNDCYSAKAKMLCLLEYMPDETLAEATAQVFAALSHACHAHPYDLPPTAAELRFMITRVADVVARFGARPFATSFSRD